MIRALKKLSLAVAALTFLANCASIESHWEAARSTDTIQSYEEFIRQYPGEDLTNQARIRLNQLYEQRNWKDTSSKNTIQAYEDFLREYPHGTFAEEAHSRLGSLYFQKAQEINTIAAYNDFLKRYSTGKVADDVVTRAGPDRTHVQVIMAMSPKQVKTERIGCHPGEAEETHYFK